MAKPSLAVKGSTIRVIRERSGLTGTDLAHLAETDRTHLSNIETGRKQPSPALATRIAEALKVPLISILAGPDHE